MTTREDAIGRPIAVGDFVTYGNKSYGTLVGEITKINPRMLTLSRIPKSKYKVRPDHAYPEDVTKVPDEDVTMWVLRGSPRNGG